MTKITFDHIAFGVWNIEDATPFLVGELGGVPHEGGPGKGFRGGQWSYHGGGRLEVLEPSGPRDGFLHRFLDRHGAGFHHVTFKVPDLRQTCARAEELGYRIVGFDDSFPAWKEAFLHPKDAMGIVVQVVESDPEFKDTWGPDWEFPPSPSPAEPSVTIVGLRLTAHEPGPTRRQWSEVLGGEASEVDGELHFRWPDSAMRVAVTLEPGRAQGPEHVELTSRRPIELPCGSHPVLGAPFVLLETTGQ